MKKRNIWSGLQGDVSGNLVTAQYMGSVARRTGRTMARIMGKNAAWSGSAAVPESFVLGSSKRTEDPQPVAWRYRSRVFTFSIQGF